MDSNASSFKGVAEQQLSSVLFYNNTDVLRIISSFLDVSSTVVVNRVRHTVDLIESVEWEDHAEQGFHLAYT